MEGLRRYGRAVVRWHGAAACSALFLAVLQAQAEPPFAALQDFRGLENWKPLIFPKIERHSIYEIVKEGGTNRVLKAASDASASGLVFRHTYEVQQYPRLRWRWKVDNIYTNADERTKAGDDYPLRVYVLFTYDPAEASIATRVKYALAKKLYGEYPPHSSLSYVWASHAQRTRSWSSPYTDRAHMVALQAGQARVGQWVEETVDVVEDYRQAFGEDPPAGASLAIMNDSDNTGERAVSYVDYLEFLPPEDTR